MPARVIGVVGAGSLRCGPEVLAALAAWAPDFPVEIRLFEANEERLDLMDRFARVCGDIVRLEHRIIASSDPEEALDGLDAVILCLTEDGARRMIATHEPEIEEPAPEAASILEFGFGDRNRPTPKSSLSESTRRLISRPLPTGTREEVLRDALQQIEAWIADKPTLDLMGDWPAELTEEERTARPHQILRWILGDPALDGVIQSARANWVTAWLKSLE